MSSNIGSIGSNSAMTMQGMRGMKRPDPTQMAENLFAKLDTSGQGYLTKADLQTAMDKVSSASSAASSGTAASVDDLFAKLDTDSDGKVTKQEFSDTLKKVADELDNQAMSMRMSGGMQGGGMGGGMSGMGGMPPPPPQDGDSGFTKDELSGQLSEIGSSDSQRSSTITDIVNNFDTADTDGDGKVTLKEAMAYEQSTQNSTASSSAPSATATDTAVPASDRDLETKVLAQIMKLMQAYGAGNDQTGSLLSTLSVTA